MQIGAILTLAGGRKGNEERPAATFGYFARDLFRSPSRMMIDVLGRSILDRTLDKARQLGATHARVISEGVTSNPVFPSRSAKTRGFIATWENAVAEQVRSGIELLLLIRMSAYTDLDYEELLDFHRQAGSPLTQVYGSSGSLDVAVLNADSLRNAGDAYRKTLSTLIPQQRRFFYHGYVNRVTDAHDLHRLAQDGLTGRCALRPMGAEVQPQVWMGDGAQMDNSAVIHGPAFIGAGSRISACCVVGGASAIERNCEVDCGTTVNEAYILQDTYVGVALDVHRAVVGNNKLFHLDRNVEVSFGDRRLIGLTAKSVPIFGNTGISAWSRLRPTG